MTEQNSQPKENFGYDVFLSYSSQDYKWVREKLLPRLKRANVRVIDETGFTIGAPIIQERERAVQQSRYTLLVISPAWLDSSWPAFDELLTSSFGMETRTWRAIPLMIAPCELPPRLQMLVKVDLTAAEIQGWRRLLRALKNLPEQAVGDTDAELTADTLPVHEQTQDPIANRLRAWIADHIITLRRIGVGALVASILTIIGLWADMLSIGQWLWPAASPATIIITTAPTAMPQSTPTSFTYGVTVLDAVGQPIAHAQVMIEIEDRAPLEDEADSSGFARIEVPASYVERAGRLRVYADGFTSHDQDIDIYPDRLPNTVRLARQ